MTRILMLTLVLALALGSAPLAAQASPSQPAAVTAPAIFMVAPAFFAPGATLSRSPAGPLSPLNGALFLDDPECESSCFQQYYECANSCSACDSCSCQLALCRAGCGVPYTGC
jgi:hypothetical protein